jgi:hypothetical protein
VGKVVKSEWKKRQYKKKGCSMALFYFPRPENSRFVPSGKK